MATEQKILNESYVAAEDLSNDQYRWAVLTASGVRRPDAETDVLMGILQNAPAAGEAAVVMEIGRSKLQMNAALAIGSFVKAEYVSATDAGKGKDAAADLSHARAIVIEASEAEDDLASVLLLGPLPAITADAWQRTTVTTKTTVGDVTYTAAEIKGGMILRDPAGGARADLFPAAADIVAAITGAVVGSSLEVKIRNTADAAETITMTTNTGLTLSGTMTIAQNNSKLFLVVCTNVGSGTEAVSVYSLGTVVH